METCASCGGETTVAEVEQKFPYGIAPHTVELTAVSPVYTCKRCGESFTDIEGELARTTAVTNYLQRQLKDVCEMRVCEIAFLILRPGRLYKFSVDPNCEKCRAYGADAYDNLFPQAVS